MVTNNFHKKILKNFKINTFLLILVYCFIFSVLCFFNQYWVTNSADDSIDIANFMNHYHGKYIVSSLLNITYGLVPAFFYNIHLNTWGQTGGAVFYSVFVIMLISTLSSLFFIKNKKNYLYPLIILINFIIFYYVFSMEHTEHYYYVFSKTFFFHCILGYIFLFLFMKKIITVLLNEVPINKKDLFELSLYTFLMGFSGDVISVFTFLFLSVLLCFKSKLKNINLRNILIIAGFLVFPLFVSSFNTQFQFSFSKVKIFETLLLGFDNFLEIFKEFNVAFIDIFKQEYCILFLIVLFLLFLIRLTVGKRNKSYNYLNFILIITFLLYCYSLFFITLGYVHAGDYAGLITHRDICFQSKLFLLMMINIQAGFLLNDIKKNKKLLIITLMFLACISYKYVVSEIKLINNVGMKNYVKEKTHIEEIRENYRNRYILERILLWYLYNDEFPIILTWNPYFYLYWKTNEKAPDNYMSFVGEYYYFKKYFNSEKYILKDIQYLDSIEEVIEKYYENGGRKITQDEIQEADFNKLLDKDWVLYGK